MVSHTVAAGDSDYVTFYLKDKNPTTGSITFHDLSSANSVNFYLRKYGEPTNYALSPMAIVTASLGYVRCLVNFPATLGTYYSQIRIFDGLSTITWKGPVYEIEEGL